MYPAPNQSFGENFENLNENLTNELGLDNSNTTSPRIFDQVYNNPETNSAFASKFLPENCQGLFAYGRLYKDQLFTKSTPAQKCILAAITNLCESPWAKAHGNAINLENWVIGYRTNHVFNAKTIGMHINDLADLRLISVETKENARWLSIIRDPVEQSEDFLPIIALDDQSLNYQESVLLSTLINASCVYARADLNFILPNSGIKNICDELIENKVFSKRTIHTLIDSLENKGLIASIGNNGGGLQINPDLAVRYGQLFNVDYSYAANELLNTRAVAKVVRYVDNPLTRTLRAQKLDLVPNGVNAIDVINTKDGILYVENDGFVDINGQKQQFNNELPYYENTLEQCNNIRKGDLFYKVDSFELAPDTELSKIARNEFYALNEKEQWIVTLDNVLNTPEHTSLAKETEEAYRLTTTQLKSLLVDGISLAETRKPLSAKPITIDAPTYLDEQVVYDREHMINRLKSYEKHPQDSAEQSSGTNVQNAATNNQVIGTPTQTLGTTTQSAEQALGTHEQNVGTNVQNAGTNVQNAANFDQNLCTYKNGIKNDLKNGDQEQKKEKEKERINNDPKNDALGAPSDTSEDSEAPKEQTIAQIIENINFLIGTSKVKESPKETLDSRSLISRAKAECPFLQVFNFSKQSKNINDLLSSMGMPFKYKFTEIVQTPIDSKSTIEGIRASGGRVVIRTKTDLEAELAKKNQILDQVQQQAIEDFDLNQIYRVSSQNDSLEKSSSSSNEAVMASGEASDEATNSPVINSPESLMAYINSNASSGNKYLQAHMASGEASDEATESPVINSPESLMAYINSNASSGNKYLQAHMASGETSDEATKSPAVNSQVQEFMSKRQEG